MEMNSTKFRRYSKLNLMRSTLDKPLFGIVYWIKKKKTRNMAFTVILRTPLVTDWLIALAE